MISITKCKRILNKNGISYTKDEIFTIRNVLYKFAEVANNIIDRENSLSAVSNESVSKNENIVLTPKTI